VSPYAADAAAVGALRGVSLPPVGRSVLVGALCAVGFSTLFVFGATVVIVRRERRRHAAALHRK